LKIFAERKGSLRKTRNTKRITVSLKDSVTLPEGYEKNDWINEHVETFLEQTQRVFAIVVNKCNCSDMTAGPSFTYLWADGVKVKKTNKSSSERIY